MKTHLYLDMRGRAADGMGSLQITLYHNGTTTSIPLGIRLKPNQWQGSCVVNHADSEKLTVIINKRKADIDTKLLLLSSVEDISCWTAAQAKARILEDRPVLHKPDKHPIITVFNDYMSQDISEGSKVIYKAALDKVLSFSGPKTTIEDIDYKYLVSFNKFMSKTQTVNGRAIYFRHLRAVCNYAIHTGLIMDYAFENFTIKTEPTQKRNISVELLREFYNYPTDKSKSRYRDYFFIMFFLVGINAVDLLKATPDMIREGRLEYNRTKTHSQLLSVKIEPEAQELLDRYKGSRYLLDALDRGNNYKYFLHRMNDALGQIGPTVYEEIAGKTLFDEPERVAKVQPIVPDITSYYARHTWATFAHKLGISSDVIGLALGHSNRTRVTWIYIEPDRSQIDAANRKVIDYFLGRSNI